ncbi:TrmO family methyltransferase domain-containing protein [Roseiarcus sp.]|uniref:TrmO family methyltransferase domain-containing protein n=1 Tax=Roseiarcus sp. TaxID=1969460 RepID=UPI003F9D2C0B
MDREDDLRLNEIAAPRTGRPDAELAFIGVIRTPWATRGECPHHGRPDGPVCRIEVSEPWAAALDGVEKLERIEVFYWLHLARRDLIRQSPNRDGTTKATFAIRSPNRSNPIGTSVVTLIERHDRCSSSAASTASTARRRCATTRAGRSAIACKECWRSAGALSSKRRRISSAR